MKTPLRILFVIDSLGFGGAERQLVELVKALKKSNRYKVHLVSLLPRSTGYGDIVEALGVNVHYGTRKYYVDVVGPILTLIRTIRANRIDLVHGFMNMGSLFGALAAKSTGRPVVCSAIRDAKDSNRKEQCLKQLLARLADIYTANSQAGFANRFKTIKPHFRVVYNGIDFKRFEKEPDVSMLKKEFDLSRFTHIIGMVGSLSLHKDQDTLLASAPDILKSFPDAGFLFVGDGCRRSLLEEKAKTLGIDHRVIFTGYRSDVDRIYCLMDAFVLLSNARKHLEGIPNVVIEAMACEVPVVASAGGGTNEVVEQGKTGIIVPPHNPGQTADAIIKILSNQEWSRSLILAARDCVHEMFGITRYATDYESIYEKLAY
jgi:glycosyltransferase involved in cell wall biosynthesis